MRTPPSRRVLPAASALLVLAAAAQPSPPPDHPAPPPSPFLAPPTPPAPAERAGVYAGLDDPAEVPRRFAAAWARRVVDAFTQVNDAAEAAEPGSGATAEQRAVLARLAAAAGALAAGYHHPDRPADPRPPLAPLLREARQHLDRGFDDPLLDALHRVLRNPARGAAMWAAKNGSEKLNVSEYPAEISLLVADLGVQPNLGGSSNSNWAPYEQMRRGSLANLIMVLRRPEPLSEHDALLLPKLVAGVARGLPVEGGQRWVDAFAEPEGIPRPPGRRWLAALLRGHLAHQLAWSHRGGGWASNVSEERWAAFRPLIALAAECLEEADRLRPQDPTAATTMVAVAMAGGGGGEPADWQRRASAADPHALAPWLALRTASLPRWGGSLDGLLGVGLRAAAEGPRGGRVPWQLLAVAEAVADDGGQAFLVRERERWRPALRALLDAEPAVGAPRDALRRRQAEALLFATAVRAGEPAEAAALLPAPPDGEPLPPSADLGWMHLLRVDKRWDPGAVLSLAGPGADANPWVTRHREDAAAARAAQAAWDRGEPVDLLADGLSGWRVSRGSAAPSPGADAGGAGGDRGTLDLFYAEGDGGGRLVHTLRPGTDWECRFTLRSPPTWAWTDMWGRAGLVLVDDEAEGTFGLPLVGLTPRGGTGWRLPGPGGEGVYGDDDDEPSTAQLPGWDTGDFVARRVGDRLSVWRDGLPIVEDVALAARFRGARLGVGVWKHADLRSESWTARVLRFEARRLPAGASTAAASDPASWVHALGPTPVVAPGDARVAAADTPAPPESPESPESPEPPDLAASSTGAGTTPTAAVAALVGDAWVDSLRAAGHADAPWADDARSLFRAEAARVAAWVDPDAGPPPGWRSYEEDAGLAERLLAGPAAADPLVGALCAGVLTPQTDWDARGWAYRGRADELTPAGHTPLAAAVLRLRSWWGDAPGGRAVAPNFQFRDEPKTQSLLAAALLGSADWLEAHPEQAAALAWLRPPGRRLGGSLTAKHLREALQPAVERGGVAGRTARKLLGVQDLTAAGWLRSRHATATEAGVGWPAMAGMAAAMRDRARANLLAVALDASTPAFERRNAAFWVSRLLEADAAAAADPAQARRLSTLAAGWAAAGG